MKASCPSSQQGLAGGRPRGPAVPGIRISPARLTSVALRGVIEEFVTRDGTDPFDAEAKIETVRDLLERGEVEIWFDPATRTCNILPA